MRVRHRILLAALAVGVVGTLAVLIWSSGPQDLRPKLEFTLLGYTNDHGKVAIVKVTNQGERAVTLGSCEIRVEGYPFHPVSIFDPRPTRIAPGSSCTLLPSVFYTTSIGGQKVEKGSATERWWMLCYVKRETLSNELRRRLQWWPLIGNHIDPPSDYLVRSGPFDQ